MNKEIVIATDMDSAQPFFEFADEFPEHMITVTRKGFTGSIELQEFIVNVTPQLLTALTAFFVARTQSLKNEIHIKKGETEIDIKNTEITPDTVLSLLEKLEQKAND